MCFALRTRYSHRVGPFLFLINPTLQTFFMNPFHCSLTLTGTNPDNIRIAVILLGSEANPTEAFLVSDSQIEFGIN